MVIGRWLSPELGRFCLSPWRPFLANLAVNAFAHRHDCGKTLTAKIAEKASLRENQGVTENGACRGMRRAPLWKFGKWR